MVQHWKDYIAHPHCISPGSAYCMFILEIQNMLRRPQMSALHDCVAAWSAFHVIVLVCYAMIATFFLKSSAFSDIGNRFTEV